MGSKMTKKSWLFLYIATGIIDLTQIILAFFAIPSGVVTDPIIGALLVAYLYKQDVPIFNHPGRLVSLLGVTGLGTITGGIAPLWIADIWYIHQSVKKDMAAQNAKEMQMSMLQNASQRPVNSDGTRMPAPRQYQGNNGPMNQGGVRRPGRISPPPIRQS